MTPTPEDPTQPPGRRGPIPPNPSGRAGVLAQQQALVLLVDLDDFVERIAQRVVELMQPPVPEEDPS